MQRLLLALGVLNFVCLIAFASYSLFFNQQKIVFVNSDQLINGYKGMVDARKAYQQKASSWKANIDTLANEVQQQIFKYEKESPKMSTKERQLSEELIRSKQKQFVDYQQAMNTKAQQEDAEMTKLVVEQINAYLKKYGKNHGYRIILAATEYGNMAYAEDGLDITESALEGLNKEYSGQ